MPIVDTSVAVATPSTTAQRMTNGSDDRRQRGEERAADVRRSSGARIGRRRLRPRPDEDHQRRATGASTSAGIRPAVNRLAIEMPVTEPSVISTMLGGIVSAIAAEEASSATRSPSLAPRRRISGNRPGATAAMSAAFEPEMPDTSIIADEQHVVEAAADVAEQRGEERDDRLARGRSPRSAGRGR